MIFTKSVRTVWLLLLTLLTLSATFGVSHAAAPANDNFAARTFLSGLSGTTTATNVDATVETGEPTHYDGYQAHSIWYKWAPTVSGKFKISTTGSNFDTILAVYSGTALTSLTQVASNDESDAFDGTSSVTVSLTANTLYSIVVAGHYEGYMGTVQLVRSQILPPANDKFASAQAITAAPATLSGSLENATREIGEPMHDTSGEGTVWYKWTPTAAGVGSIELSEYGPYVGVYTGTAVGSLTQVDVGYYYDPLEFQVKASTTYYIAVASSTSLDTGFSFNLGYAPAPANDNFAAAQSVTSFAGTINGTAHNASRETGEPTHEAFGDTGTVWYKWTSTTAGVGELSLSGYNTYVGIYTGTAVGALTSVAHANSYEDVRFPIKAATTYYMAVAADAESEDTFYLYASFLTGPANDNFASAQAITTLPAAVSGTTVNASLEKGEPESGYGYSVWYKWTATVTGKVAIDADASITVFKGTSVGALTEVGDYQFPVTAGTTYYI
ncbi:MAG TPA: hypothetical protein VF719_08260, partial [Abditibacteriaceae bacterium]